MSIVIQYHQKTKEFKRLLYFPNNIAEIVESHGISMLDNQNDYYNHHKSLKKPFNLLPEDYDKMDLEHQLFMYDIAYVHQLESVEK